MATGGRFRYWLGSFCGGRLADVELVLSSVPADLGPGLGIVGRGLAVE